MTIPRNSHDVPDVFVFGIVNMFRYRHLDGRIETHWVVPLYIHFGSRGVYTEPQWLLECFDPVKGYERTFALSNVITGEKS